MLDIIYNELIYKFTPSSGPGGQNVNKVSTRVEVRFNVPNSKCLNSYQKEILLEKLNHRMNSQGDLIIVCDETRSQKTNREIVTKRIASLIENTLVQPKKRKQTRPSRASKEKRLKDKKIRSDKKSNRKNEL